jgi:hypothetical protein
MQRPLVIDVSNDLPPRSKPLSDDALSQVFGGCIAVWQPCTQNYECCSYACDFRIWMSHQQTYVYECGPAGSQYH